MHDVVPPDVAKELILRGFWYGAFFGTLCCSIILFIAILGDE